MTPSTPSPGSRVRATRRDPTRRCDDVADAARPTLDATALQCPAAGPHFAAHLQVCRVVCVLRSGPKTTHGARTRGARGNQMTMRRAGLSSGVIERPIDAIVVEDHEDTRELIVELLRMHGCRVRPFGCAEDAFAAALADVPDVVVTDLVLRPHRATGWALAEMLRREAATRHVALIALTGRVDPRTEIVRAFDAYLRKPAEVDLMLDLVVQLTKVSRNARERRSAIG
jgi:CheY-like chemotaxis protein